MIDDFKFSVDDGVVHIVYTGDIVFEKTAVMMSKVVEIASENNTNLLFFDVREVGKGNYHTNAIQHTEKGPSMGIDHRFRISFFGREDDYERLRYIENVMVNRGFQAKIFFDKSEALDWLKKTL